MLRHPAILILWGVLGACGGGDPAASPDAGLGADASGPNTVGGCSATALDRCVYGPPPGAGFQPAPPMTTELEYLDLTGAPRRFQIAVRAPIGAPEPLPVVVWSHGGNDGHVQALTVGTEWAAIFVAAGYVVIDIAHPPRSNDSRAALCPLLGYDATTCPAFKYLHWDRPHDAARVFDFLEAQAANGPFAGRIDTDHIVYAGHSAGSGSVEMVNGAARDYAGMTRTLPDPRPVAFITNSPEGPGDDGFTDTSYGGCARPNLLNSGIGDDTNVFGEDRSRMYDLMPAGDKYRLFLGEEAARHGMFDQNADACEDYSTSHGLDPARCTSYKTWIASSALAFLDAYARGSAPARAYLASDNLVVLAGGSATWSRK